MSEQPDIRVGQDWVVRGRVRTVEQIIVDGVDGRRVTVDVLPPTPPPSRVVDLDRVLVDLDNLRTMLRVEDEAQYASGTGRGMGPDEAVSVVEAWLTGAT